MGRVTAIPPTRYRRLSLAPALPHLIPETMNLFTTPSSQKSRGRRCFENLLALCVMTMKNLANACRLRRRVRTKAGASGCAQGRWDRQDRRRRERSGDVALSSGAATGREMHEKCQGIEANVYSVNQY